MTASAASPSDVDDDDSEIDDDDGTSIDGGDEDPEEDTEPDDDDDDDKKKDKPMKNERTAATHPHLFALDGSGRCVADSMGLTDAKHDRARGYLDAKLGPASVKLQSLLGMSPRDLARLAKK